jgi:hypothetical protein
MYKAVASKKKTYLEGKLVRGAQSAALVHRFCSHLNSCQMSHQYFIRLKRYLSMFVHVVGTVRVGQSPPSIHDFPGHIACGQFGPCCIDPHTYSTEL